MVGANAIAGNSVTNSYGIWYSSDSGETWQKSTATITPFNGVFVSLSMVGEKAIAVGSTSSLGIWYSSNSGQAWTKSTSIDASFNELIGASVSMVNNNDVYNAIVTGSNGIWYSNNYGETWTKSTSANTGFASLSNFSSLSMVGEKAIAASSIFNSNSGIWYSSDSGQLWNPSSLTSGRYNVYMSGTNAVAVLLSSNQLWYSSNSGQNWTESSLSQVTNASYRRVFLENKNVIVIYGSTTSTLNSRTYYAIGNNSIPCFNKDSKILTDKGYVPIQDLRKGDMIKTVKHGYKPLCMIGSRKIQNVVCNERIKDKLYICTNKEYPELLEDLIITGCHAILVGGFKEGEREHTLQVLGDIYVTDDHYRLSACVDKRAIPYEKEGIFTIYHIALENDDYYMNYGIYANGLLVETCSKRYLKELSNMELF